jgi:conjugative transposon TraJ protein
MKSIAKKAALMVAAATLLPLLSHAQGVAADLQSLQGVLNTLYTQMIPLCSGMIGIGQAIAGFAALWYIAVRVWKHLAAAEPIDFYPLLRPFVIGFCIVSFPAVLDMINGVLSPTVTATAAMVTNSNQAIETMLNNDQQQTTQQPASTNTNGDPDKWYQYSHPDNSTATGTNTNPIADQFSDFGIKNMIKKMIYEILNVLFEAAALCIDTIRTFKLIVLAILGPLCFGLSVFDGFQHTLKQWLARYVNVYMWLPVANIFGAIIAKIQANLIQMGQSGATAPSFSTTNAYLIFMVIGIVGYFTVPGIANYIMNVGGHALFNKTTALASMAISAGANAAFPGAGGSGISSSTDAGGSKGSSAGASAASSYMKDKLSGKSNEDNNS